MVFGTLALFDCLILALILVSIAFGWYGDEPKKQGADADSNASNAPEKVTNLEDAGFADEFPDVPFARDLYEEAVPEVSEYREETLAMPYSLIDNSLIEGTVRGTVRQNSIRYQRDTVRKSRHNIEDRSRLISETF